MKTTKNKFRSGIGLVELCTTMLISTILVLCVGILLVGGQRAWNETLNSSQKKVKQDAQLVMIRFGSVGRRANRLAFEIYEIEGNIFTPVEPETSEEEVISGDAVEFRLWDSEIICNPEFNEEIDEENEELLEPSCTGTAYVLFYLDNDELMVDYGPYPPGGVPDGGGSKRTPTRTEVLAENVTTDPQIGAFSTTVIGQTRNGCIRINITLTDPNDGETIKVLTSTLLRNQWPR